MTRKGWTTSLVLESGHGAVAFQFFMSRATRSTVFMRIGRVMAQKSQASSKVVRPARASSGKWGFELSPHCCCPFFVVIGFQQLCHLVVRKLLSLLRTLVSANPNHTASLRSQRYTLLLRSISLLDEIPTPTMTRELRIYVVAG